MSRDRIAIRVLTMNTLAFTICFACWMMNGVLMTYLVDNGAYRFDKAQLGWLLGVPVLTGSILRLPVGVLTDRFGGRRVFAILMAISAVPLWLMSRADSYLGFLVLSLLWGASGASFAVGIAYSSVWFSKERQGTALGIFGAGNAGSAITSAFAPYLLNRLTDGGTHIEGWRTMPRIYAGALLAMSVIFYLATEEKRADGGAGKSMAQRLAPLRHVRVWRFGLYYFLVFGGFVALAQWLIPYYVSAYRMTVVSAGLLATVFSLPSGVIRALGGWMSDKFGARSVMYWVLGTCGIGCFLLIVPRMQIESPGEGVLAIRGGVVTAIGSGSITVGDHVYQYLRPSGDAAIPNDEMMVWPRSTSWQEPVVVVGEKVLKKQLLARGITHIYFQSNVIVFTVLVFVVGIMMGIGKAAVYRHIPDYFPNEVGVVGGMVGVIGGLGGFFCPIIFGYLLRATGLWTTCWMFFFVLSLICLTWMHWVVRRLTRTRSPEIAHEFDDRHRAGDARLATPTAKR